MIAQILDHITRALARLIQQYKEKPKLKAILETFAGGFQDAEDGIYPLFEEQWVDNAVGVQLDRFGEIVVQDRNGFDDDFYRILLKVKIGINNSSGVPEDVISALKLLTGATLVHNQSLGLGSIGIGVDTTIDPGLVDFIYDNMEKVVMDGIRIDFITCFDPDEPFSFDGTGPIGLGFSSLGAPTTGGKFGFIHRRTAPAFAFDTEAGAADPGASGFGTILDPLAGGILQGL